MINLTEGNDQKSSLGAFALKVFFLAILFILSFFSCFNLVFSLVYVYVRLSKLVYSFV